MCIHSTLQELPDRECLVDLEGAIQFPAASLNRLVAHPSFRGKRVAPNFDQARIALAIQLGAKGCLVTTHKPGRLLDLQEAGFVLLAKSPYRTVPQLPAFVLWKELRTSGDPK